jgi:hypothetical protein
VCFFCGADKLVFRKSLEFPYHSALRIKNSRIFRALHLNYLRAWIFLQAARRYAACDTLSGLSAFFQRVPAFWLTGNAGNLLRWNLKPTSGAPKTPCTGKRSWRLALGLFISARSKIHFRV